MAPYKEAFLVNLWVEPAVAGTSRRGSWRGSVVHLITQERRYFNQIADLAAFLTVRTELANRGRGDVSP